MGKTAVVVLVLLFVPTLAAAGPIVSDEIVVDHGFRYLEPVESPERVALAVQDSVIFLAFGDGPGSSIIAYRRSDTGKEIDINGKRLIPNPRETSNGPFDLDDFDGVGWKLAFLTDHDRLHVPHGLRVRNLDPVSLDSTQDDLVVVSQAVAVLSYPAVSSIGDLHVVVWVHRDSVNRIVKLMRFNRDLEPLDSSPIDVGAHLMDATISLATSANRGIVVWVDEHRRVNTCTLGQSGFPGSSQMINASGPLVFRSELTTVCRLGGGWLVAWVGREHTVAARLDSLGTVLPPGAFALPGSFPSEGLAAAGSDSLALVAWRNVDAERVEAIRIDSSGVVLDQLPIIISRDAPYSGWTGTDPRNLDCATVGGRFVVLWNVSVPFPTAQFGRGPSTFGPLSLPVLAQWIKADGSIVFPEAIVVNQAAHPSICAIQAVDDRYLLVERDRACDDLYIYKTVLDSTGAVIGQPFRQRTRVERTVESHDYLTGLDASSWDQDAALLYGFTERYSSENYGMRWEEASLILERQSSDGTPLREIEIQIGSDANGAPAPRLTGLDAVGKGSSILVAYSAARGDIVNSYVRVELIPTCGRLLHYWSLVSQGPDTDPAVAPLGDRYLVAWNVGQSPDELLYRVILDPSNPETMVQGGQLVRNFGMQGAPALIQGPDQVLCVFPARLSRNGPLGDDIYGIRIDLQGYILDRPPIVFCESPGDQGEVQGVWDGRNYVVIWSNVNSGYEVFGNRVGESGAPLDGNGFAISDEGFGPLSITSNKHGTSMIAYNGNRIRVIHDVDALGDGGDPDSSGFGNDRATARVPHFGNPSPNPTHGGVHMELSEPLREPVKIVVVDVSGRNLLSRSIDMDAHGSMEIWDGLLPEGNPAPAGIYYLRMVAGSRTAVRRVVVLR